MNIKWQILVDTISVASAFFSFWQARKSKKAKIAAEEAKNQVLYSIRKKMSDRKYASLSGKVQELSSILNKKKQTQDLILKNDAEFLCFFSKIEELNAEFFDNCIIKRLTNGILKYQNSDLKLEDLNNISKLITNIRAECNKHLEAINDE